MGIDRDTFYESWQLAIVPWTSTPARKDGRLRRKDFADTWHPRLLAMPKLEMTILVGARH